MVAEDASIEVPGSSLAIKVSDARANFLIAPKNGIFAGLPI